MSTVGIILSTVRRDRSDGLHPRWAAGPGFVATVVRMRDDLAELAAEAYVYGYPLVFNLEQVQRYVSEGVGSNPAAPWNSFSHARRLAGPADTFVTINNDTVYSMAQLDLGVGPVRLTVPPTGDRYFVFQFVDAWTNNFAYVGRRSAGGDGGTFYVVPPAWEGDTPAGTTRIDAPTRIVSIVGRFACDGPDDIPAIAALQDQTLIEPVDTSANAAGLPQPASVPDGTEFFEKLRCWGSELPPSAPEVDWQQRLAPLGVLDATSPYTDAGSDLVEAVAAGEAQGKEKIEQISHHGPSKVINGWTVGIHMFDYNLDHFGFGTVDSPDWKIGDRDAAHLERAVAARVGLWGNHGYEAVYAQVFVDDHGDQLTSDHHYVIHFDQDPPVGAFWSVTMYDIPNYYLVDNPIDRYSIGDRTSGVRRDAEDGLTVYVQRSEPDDPTARANWLPTPDGPFRMVLRLYQPGDSVLDGSYQIPPATRPD